MSSNHNPHAQTQASFSCSCARPTSADLLSFIPEHSTEASSSLRANQINRISDLSTWECCGGEDTCQNSSMRGGNDESSHARHVAYSKLARGFNHLYSRLLHNTLAAGGTAPPSTCTKAWVSLAGILQRRNAYLEHRLEECKEMHGSAVEYLKWYMDVLGELESGSEVLKDEYSATAMETEELRSDIVKGKGRKKRMKEQVPRKQREKKTGKSRRGPIRSKEVAVDTAAKDEGDGDLSTTSFYFYPWSSTIVVPGLPSQILKFPRGTSLPDIHDFLNSEYKAKEPDACVAIVRKIMDARAKMGIQLPELLLNESVVISVPEVRDGEVQIDDTVEIAAWRTTEGEDKYAGSVDRELPYRPTSILKVEKGFHHRLEQTIDIPELSAFMNSQHFPDDDEAPAEFSDSICSCTLCASEHDPDIPVSQSRRRFVSVRGGADDDDDYDDYHDDDEYYDDHDDENWAWAAARAEADYDLDDESVVHEDEARDPYDDWQ
ncbi:hypothetical protein DE146DRAFT_215130 [Phaeosphaeria sp. MPI-PUGE-AT-0046c]|nr:hypothetical protein DE146DRAFT_215130 [Phaeosphaeria sp. MPI-PUGE-AT-0046c]